ncbi:extensin [Iris pallida]|uniref:Extensin n=1 Tax=Iris pallida TaxID=29817 RepID=A0AAX6HGH3_IRIPA|nr:extensin [Iris pallida]
MAGSTVPELTARLSTDRKKEMRPRLCTTCYQRRTVVLRSGATSTWSLLRILGSSALVRRKKGGGEGRWQWWCYCCRWWWFTLEFYGRLQPCGIDGCLVLALSTRTQLHDVVVDTDTWTLNLVMMNVTQTYGTWIVYWPLMMSVAVGGCC